jgi:hypothetical protein
LHFESLLGETTVREIVKDCWNSIWNCLKATEMPENTENDWLNIANDFYRRMQFPNCIGAVDAKQLYNYKHFSVSLLALVDANYCFIAVDVGTFGKSSDSNDFKKSDIGRKLESNQLRIPGSRPFPSNENWKCIPFVVVGETYVPLCQMKFIKTLISVETVNTVTGIKETAQIVT